MFKPGDRVYITDPVLAQIRAFMQRATGQDPEPNHHGTVHEVGEDRILIYFDSEEGEGMGSAAPYPPSEVRHLV